jgi:hypothetical protein
MDSLHGSWLDQLLAQVPGFVTLLLVAPQVLICSLLLWRGGKRVHSEGTGERLPPQLEPLVSVTRGPALGDFGKEPAQERLAPPAAPRLARRGRQRGELFRLGPVYDEERLLKETAVQQQDAGVLGDIFAQNLRLLHEIGAQARARSADLALTGR